MYKKFPSLETIYHVCPLATTIHISLHMQNICTVSLKLLAQSPGSLGLMLCIVLYISLEIVSLGLEIDELKDKLFSHYTIVDTEKW